MIAAPVLSLGKGDGLTSVLPGQMVTYTLAITNTGNQEAIGVVLTDTLSPYTSFVTASLGSTVSNGTVVWAIGSLPAQDSVTRTVTAQVVGALPTGVDTITNTATVADLTGNSVAAVDVDRLANAPPVAADDLATTNEDTAVQIASLANDSDPNGDSLLIAAVGPAVHGAAASDGLTIVYTPTQDFNGTDAFTYTLSDGSLTATASVTVTVVSINDAPIARDDTASTDENAPVTVAVLSNDSDPDGDLLAVTAASSPIEGTATSGGISVVFTPTLNFVGTAVFTYTISDGSLSASAAVTVTVTGTPPGRPGADD